MGMIFAEPGAPSRSGPVAQAMAAAFLLVGAAAIGANLRSPFVMDFLSFWSASVLALAGDAPAAYDFAAHAAAGQQGAGVEARLPFAYPPLLLLLLSPFGLLPYGSSAAAWVVVTFGAYIAAVRRFAPGAGWLAAAFPPVVLNAITGQSGFLTAALFIGGMALLPKRPLAAGLVLGCLIVKPHLGLLLPLVFVAGRQWRAFAGAAASSAALVLAGLVAYGPETYLAWLDQAPLFASILADGLSGWHRMASAYAALRLAGCPEPAAWAIHAAIAAAAAATACLIWRRDCTPGTKAAALAAATAIASPYLYVYDTLILVVPFLWLASVERSRALLGLLWCLPLVSVAQNWGFNESVNLAPAVPIALLALIARRTLFSDQPSEGRFSAAASEAVALPRRAGLG